MNKQRHSLLYYIKYLTTVITWAIFTLLMCVAAFLGYYFLQLKMCASKGEQPPFSIYTIVSPSMVPTINVYDVIFNIKVDKPEDIHEGDIITFISTSSISDGLTITHRVNKVLRENGEYLFETKGDNNLVKDSMPAPFSNVIGKAYLRLPYVGKLQFFLSSGIGWIMVVVVPSLIVIIKDIIKLIKVSKIRKEAQMANIRMMMEEKNKQSNE